MKEIKCLWMYMTWGNKGNQERESSANMIFDHPLLPRTSILQLLHVVVRYLFKVRLQDAGEPGGDEFLRLSGGKACYVGPQLGHNAAYLHRLLVRIDKRKDKIYLIPVRIGLIGQRADHSHACPGAFGILLIYLGGEDIVCL